MNPNDPYVVWTTLPFTWSGRIAYTKSQFLVIGGSTAVIIAAAWVFFLLVSAAPELLRGDPGAYTGIGFLLVWGAAMASWWLVWWYVGRRGALEEKERRALETEGGLVPKPPAGSH